MDLQILEEIPKTLSEFGLDTDRLISDFNSILKVKLSSSDELMTFLSFETYDNFKHLSLLIGMNMLEFIDENSYFLDNHYITTTLVRLISMFKNKLNIMLENSDEDLLKYVIEPYINSKLTHLSIDNMVDNEELISNYRANYSLLWYHYQDLISKIVKQVIDIYIDYICISRFDKSKFLYVIICGIMEYSWNKIDDLETYNQLKESIQKEFTSIVGDVSYLIDLKGEEYMTSIVDSINNLLISSSGKKVVEVLENTSMNKIIIESTTVIDQGSEILRNTKEGKFSGVILTFIKSIGYSFFINCDVMKQYFIIKKLFNSIFVTRDLIEIIVKIDNEISENERYFNIISGNIEGLIINLINDIFANKTGNIKFLDEHQQYDIKNMINIVSMISKNDDMPKVSVIEYLTKGISMTIDKLTDMYLYLEKFKIKRTNNKNGMKDMTEGEKQRLRIIKMILDDRPVWIINDCLFNINDITKRDIIKVIMKIVKKENKTIIVTDSSNSADYLM